MTESSTITKDTKVTVGVLVVIAGIAASNGAFLWNFMGRFPSKDVFEARMDDISHQMAGIRETLHGLNNGIPELRARVRVLESRLEHLDDR